ncbi:MAG: carboxypeptidase regulatory-like domain-containing protein [Chloroflexi bacterium]|nr:carboxypeptidase regulatory-like domain-containing protein [Chloroflexota bacterium]
MNRSYYQQFGKVFSLIVLFSLMLSSFGLNNAPAAQAEDQATSTDIATNPIDIQPTDDPQATPTPSEPTATPTLAPDKAELENRPTPEVGALAIPPNDNFNSAIVISDFPSAFLLDTTGATVASDDPIMGCGYGKNSNTVWYRILAPVPGHIRVNTFGSNYDTVAAAFSGIRGALKSKACNDDFSGTLQSQIEFAVLANKSYYIEIADFGTPGGGLLQVTTEFAPVALTVPLEIALLQDETGSMWDDVDTLKRLAPQIWDSVVDIGIAGFRMGVAGFRDYGYYPYFWGGPDDWVYRRRANLTNSRTAFVSGVNALTAGGGSDWPESQYAALHYLMTPSHPCIDSNGDGDCLDSGDTPIGQQLSFRAGVLRIILLATDAPFHDPIDTFGYPGPNVNTVVNDLLENQAIVIGLVPGGAGVIPEVDYLASITGGSTQNTGSTGDDVAEAIINALGSIETYSISGRVTDPNNPHLSGVILTDGHRHTAITDSNGYYAFKGLPAGTYTITPNKEGLSFSDPSLTINVPPDQGEQNFTVLRPVVVLVHGWHGHLKISPDNYDRCLRGDGTYYEPYRVTDNNLGDQNWPSDNQYGTIRNDFGAFPDFLRADGYDVWIAHVSTGHNWTPFISINAVCLQNQLTFIHNNFGVDEFTLIAHSMGGLVSRAYIESFELYPRDPFVVSRLITLGAPHAGTPFGEFYCTAGTKQDAACEFGIFSIFEFNDTYKFRDLFVQYNFIAGNSNPIETIGLYLTEGPHDGAVGAQSAIGNLYMGILPPIPAIQKGSNVMTHKIRASHSSAEVGEKNICIPLTDKCYTVVVGLRDWFPSYFNQSLRDNSTLTDTYKCIQQILGKKNGNCPVVTSGLAEAQATSNPKSQIPVISGHISSGQLVTRLAPVDSNEHSEFTLVWDAGNINFTLESPSGTIIDPVYVAAHPNEVQYMENTIGPSQLFATYNINASSPGIYILKIASGDVGTSGTDYAISSLVVSPRVLDVTVDKLVYSVGETATITATLKNGNLGLNGATATAKIFRPGVFADTITLSGQGNGVYKGAYTIPNIPGYLGLSVIAEGSDAGTAYARQVDSLIAVAPQTVQLVGSYSDSPVNADGNDKYERLDVGVGLNALQAGSYLLSADLVSGTTVVAHSVTSTTLPLGNSFITLPFSGDEIGQSGKNGPYKLTNLTIADQQNAGVPTIWQAQNLWTTAAYNFQNFAAHCYTLALAANPPIGGTITANPPPNCNSGSQYAAGTTVALTAAADTGYAFAGWNGDASGSPNPARITIHDESIAVVDFSIPLKVPSLALPAHNGVVTIYTPTLDWNDVTPPPDHYQIQIATDSAFLSMVRDETVADSSYTLNDPINPDTAYYWRARSVNSVGQFGAWSPARLFHAAMLPPESFPTSNFGTTPLLRPVFDWTPTTGTTSYSIQVSTDQNFNTLALNLNVTPSAHVPASDLPKGATLFWRVRANGPNGPSAWSRVRHFDTPSPPGVPTLLSPANNAATSTQPTLDWSDSSPGADHYEVQLSTSETFATVLGRGRGGRTSASMYTPEVALPSGTYHWRVRAVNAQGQFSNWSSSRSFRVP